MCGEHLFDSVPILASDILNEFTLGILQEIVHLFEVQQWLQNHLFPICLFVETYSFSSIWYFKALYISYILNPTKGKCIAV